MIVIVEYVVAIQYDKMRYNTIKLLHRLSHYVQAASSSSEISNIIQTVLYLMTDQTKVRLGTEILQTLFTNFKQVI